MSNPQKVAIYGLGNMGFPVARRIGSQFPTQVFDLDQAALQRASAGFGATAIQSPADLADTHVVVLCLPNPAISQAVLTQIASHLPKGSVVLETSTVNPEHIHAAQKLLTPYGIDMVDASIMAGVSQMEAGSASLALGGSQDAIRRSQPVLDAIASKQTYFGESGAGAAAKVINNAVAHAVMVVVAEAGALATASGVSCEKLIALLSDKQMGLHRPLTAMPSASYRATTPVACRWTPRARTRCWRCSWRRPWACRCSPSRARTASTTWPPPPATAETITPPWPSSGPTGAAPPCPPRPRSFSRHSLIYKVTT
jgi:3-hydroxyisobutyrate dehydrogenase-like beta-hydroxyacid dehydrogenase